MIYQRGWLAQLLFFLATTCCAEAEPHARPQSRGIHLPLVRKEIRRTGKRSGGIAAIGLGDDLDVTYNVLVQVGGTATPLVLDTGSADLWVISDACHGNCSVGVPLYPQATFEPAGLNVELLYGDSRTGTHASGPIGKDAAGLAGLAAQNQYFAAITDTNTTVLETGSAGIFGLGFPAISVIWRQLIQAQLNSKPPSKRSEHVFDHNLATRIFPDFNFRQPAFPSFDFLKHPAPPKSNAKRQSFTSSDAVIASFGSYGPMLARLISQQMVSSPMISVTLQRDTLDIGGNIGLLSIGALPPGVQTDRLTWTPIRSYSVAEGGLPPSPEAPNEVYPLVWEIPVDDVYFDGVKLARSSLSPSSISLSALLDTGNSLIRGPQDVLEQIQRSLGGPTFDCAKPHNLTFEIGGKPFSVDPRDFVQPFTDSVNSGCVSTLAATDPPGNGFLYSWSLGVPFIKSALVAFHYGNLTRPSQDPPRIGLLSTVPGDAGARLAQAVQDAQNGDGSFPATSESAPSGTFVAAMTGVGGVPQATHTGTGMRSSSRAAKQLSVLPMKLAFAVVLGGVAGLVWV